MREADAEGEQPRLLHRPVGGHGDVADRRIDGADVRRVRQRARTDEGGRSAIARRRTGGRPSLGVQRMTVTATRVGRWSRRGPATVGDECVAMGGF